MLFNSFEFLFLFLPATWCVWRLFCRYRRTGVALAWLLAASLFFYTYWNPKYLSLLSFSIAVNYIIGRGICRFRRGTQRKEAPCADALLLLGIAMNLSLIGYYKYSGFFLENAGAVFGFPMPVHEIFLPLGISFFTFQQIAWLVDSRRGTVRTDGFVDYALFVSFFPQLIAGPIVRAQEILPQFGTNRTFAFSWKNLCFGISLLSLGLFKKVVIADTFSPLAAAVFDGTDVPTFVEAWGGALAYTFQIYFDFSGYSDMALGLGRLFNITLPENFDSPYTACSIVDFWRRWHMTLSAFLRDYLYIPLGGNRRGTVRRYLNLMATMLLGGLWHGAGWTFVIWGGLHGACLTLNHLWRGARMPRLPKPLAWMATFLAVVAGWVFFRSATCGRAFSILSGMAGLNGIVLPPDYALAELVPGVLRFLGIGVAIPGVWHFEGRFQTVALAVGFLLCLALPNSFAWCSKYPWRDRPAKTRLIVGTALVAVVLSLHRVSEFLYFRF
jgi:alginate O-acetyltransferase complex protein AlgI